MRFRYLEDAMDYIVIESSGKVWCNQHQAWSGLMVKDAWASVGGHSNNDRFKVVTKCCEKEVVT